MSQSHTKGPWVIDGAEDGIFAKDDLKVCSMYRGGILQADGEQEANARLIAAAPDLLEALKALADRVDRFTFDGGKEQDAARAVLAKAEGRA